MMAHSKRNNKIFIGLLIFSCLIIPMKATAQNISEEVPATWQSRIKLIDQFMSRFNGTNIPDGANTRDPQLRLKLMASVFDFDYLNAHENECLQFINYMIRGGYKLNYEDTNWYAIAKCEAFCRGRSTMLTIVLRTEKDSKGLNKWSIYRVQGDMLDFQPTKTSDSFKILPADNEVDFIHLADITSHDVDIILNYSSNDFEIDQTTAFFTLVATEQLRIKQVNELSYQFEKGKYRFTVSRFNRETTNSGWLISQISTK